MLSTKLVNHECSKKLVTDWDDSVFQPDEEIAVGTGSPSLRYGEQALF